MSKKNFFFGTNLRLLFVVIYRVTVDICKVRKCYGERNNTPFQTAITKVLKNFKEKGRIPENTGCL